MLPTDPNLRAGLIDFIKRSFVDIADQNYISARILYRYNLKHDFLWAAQQAIEKYLLDNPKLSKPALVELLTKRFSSLSTAKAWIIVSHYFNKKT